MIFAEVCDDGERHKYLKNFIISGLLLQSWLA